jgi:hypothetical protein
MCCNFKILFVKRLLIIFYYRIYEFIGEVKFNDCDPTFFYIASDFKRRCKLLLFFYDA